MDLTKLKNKLKNLQEVGGGNKEKKDYSLTTYQPSIGKQQIRILPWNKDITTDDFLEVLFYYNIGKKLMLSPMNFGEKDPIDLFVQQLKAQEYTPENFYLYKKLEAKTRVFLPVIVRGEEDKGVRMWQFGKLIYEELVKYALDDETEGYENIVNGRDFTVETVDKKHTGTGYNKTTLRPRLKTSPLSDDKTLVKTWTTEQPNPLVEYENCKFSFEDMKEALGKFLTPEEEVEEKVEEQKSPVSSTQQFSSNKKPNSTKEDKFDEIFAKEQKENEPDDLPF